VKGVNKNPTRTRARACRLCVSRVSNDERSVLITYGEAAPPHRR